MSALLLLAVLALPGVDVMPYRPATPPNQNVLSLEPERQTYKGECDSVEGTMKWGGADYSCYGDANGGACEDNDGNKWSEPNLCDG